MPKKSDKYSLLQEELVSLDLILDRDAIYRVLLNARSYPDKFTRLAYKNKTTNDNISFNNLIKWLSRASREIYELSGRFLWSYRQSKNRFGISRTSEDSNKKRIDFNRAQDIQDAIQLLDEVYRRSPDNQAKLGIKLARTPVSKTKRSKKVSRTLQINGVSAIELNTKRSANLSDPILDVNLKINNPVGRLWKAIKRLWKNQKTVVALKFTIPLLVLPLVLYAAFRLWQGRGVNIPISKLGVVHEVSVEGHAKDILILPTSDAFILEYGSDFNPSTRILEAPVIVIGTFNQLKNKIVISEIIPYDQQKPSIGAINEIRPSNESLDTLRSIWNSTWNFFKYFK